jgi:hypothetical protein
VVFRFGVVAFFVPTRGPQKPSSKNGAVKPEIERVPGNSQNVCGRNDDGRTEMGKNWTKGKGKNSQRKYGKPADRLGVLRLSLDVEQLLQNWRGQGD